jgi:serine/threonine-protein kinase
MAQINETPPELPATIAEPVRNLVYSSIAKSPADRPASAAHLARAAQALRQGDVAAAAASVPGVVGTGSLTLAAGANYGNPTTATRVLPAADGGQPPPKRRNPWTWPLIALVAVLLLVLVGTVIALLASPGNPKPTQSATNSHTPPSSPSPTPTLITFNPKVLAGMNKSQAQAELTKLGLGTMMATTGDGAPTLGQVGTVEVSGVTQYQNLTPGETISVPFYGPQQPPPQPSAPTSEGTAPYGPGSSVTIDWVAYEDCPSGQALSGYIVTVTNGTASMNNPLSPSTLSESIMVGSTGETDVSYVAVCGSGSSSVNSSASNSLSLPIGP